MIRYGMVFTLWTIVTGRRKLQDFKDWRKK